MMTKTRRQPGKAKARGGKTSGGRSRRIEREVAGVVSGRPSQSRSYVAKYWSTDGTPMLGGVLRSESTPFSHREDAESFLAASIENNASAGQPVAGEVVPSGRPAGIKRHCPGYPAQALGGVCFGCRQVVR